MDWSTALPIVNGTVGGFFMAVAIWAIVTNRVALPREVQVYQQLWTEEKATRVKVEEQNDQLVADLRRSHDTLSETSRALQKANDLLTGLLKKQGVVE